LILGVQALAQAPPSLQVALQEAQWLLAKRKAALQASDVFKEYDAARTHVATLTALVAAEKPKETGSK
jgi:hypothetical protein